MNTSRFKLLLLLLAALCLTVAMSAGAQSPRRELIEQYDAQAQNADWDTALKTAQQLLEYAQRETPVRPQDVVEANTLIGRAYLALDNTAAAEQSFTTALQMAEQQLGATDSRLVEPLTGLGLLYGRTQRHDQAVATLERALIISRRNSGLFDLKQAELLKQLTESYTELGAVADAQRHLSYLRSVAERSYGTRDPRVVPTLCDVAEWYSRIGDGVTARVLYRQAIGIVHDKRGKASPEMVPALSGLARSYRRELVMPRIDDGQRERSSLTFGAGPSLADESLEPRAPSPRYLNPEGEHALERAVKILELQEPGSPPALRRAIIDLGDWFQVKQDERRALALYRRAAAMHIAGQAQLEANADHFRIPVSVYYPVPISALRYIARPIDELELHSVLVEFTVTKEGEVTNPTVIEEDASRRQVSDTLAAISQARFRPRLIDGEPVATTGVRHRQVFRSLKKSAALQPAVYRRMAQRVSIPMTGPVPASILHPAQQAG